MYRPTPLRIEDAVKLLAKSRKATYDPELLAR